MNKLVQYMVYVDDGWGVWTGTLEELKTLTRMANEINPRFQVTLDHTAGENKRLVILDLEAWIERGKVEHMFYRKPTAKEYCLPATSAHSIKTKASYIQSECMRIRLLCSKQEYAWVHLERFRSRLIQGGYPMWFIDKHFSLALNRYSGIVRKVSRGERSLYRSREERREEQSNEGPKKGPPGDAPTFWIETTTESIAQQFQVAAVSNGLDIRVREKAGTNVKQKLCRSTINPLEHNKVWGGLSDIFPEDEGSARWLVRDVVYRVKCLHCSECYTGETSQPLHKRMYYHWYGLRGQREEESALTQHYLEHHKDAEGNILPMNLELVQAIKTCGYVERKIMEAVVQAMFLSSINRRIEGAGTVGNLYL